MEVVVEPAEARTFGQDICLFVEGSLGTLRVRPSSGTINGGTAVSFVAEQDTLVMLRSNGQGRWNMLNPLAHLAGVPLTAIQDITQARLLGRASGAGTGPPTELTAAQVADIIETADYSWTGQHVHAERAAAPTVAAGQGAIWWRNISPSQATVTDDLDNNWAVGYACPATPLVTNAAATAATTNLTCVSYTVPAGVARVGTLYRFTGWFKYTHDVGTTPEVVAELLLDGVVIETASVRPFASFTGSGKVEAVVCFRTIGVGGTLKGDLMFASNMGVTTDYALIGNITTSTDAVDTTGARTFLLRIRMSTAAASNTLTVVQGYPERLA
jgi:hypothetical protein